ncbi:MAG: hypothetical protein JNM00_02075 [Flavobacteriales bacterium]|nr:hypothetical protein [Flavobacteriales bacterium]
MKTMGVLLGLACLLLLTPDASARKVICIDDNGNANDGFLNGHEGWERQNAKPGDVIQKGGSLTDCINQLQNGDTLVIVAHGYGSGQGFQWGGEDYEGFGDDEGEMPLPPGFNKTGIHIKFCSCWSARDPDGPGADNPDTSLLDKLKSAMGGGATGEGFTDLSESQICWKWSGGTAAQCNAVGDSLKKDSNWLKYPPHNRPGPPPQTDQSCAQAIANAIAAGVTVTISYKQPKNVTSAVAPAGGIIVGCATCAEGCGLHSAMGEDVPDIPELIIPSNLVLPNGLWRCDNTLVFPFSQLLQPNVEIRTLRLFNLLSGSPVPPPGGFGTLFTPVEAVLEISYDGGATWHSSNANGTIQGSMNQPPFLPGIGGGLYVDMNIFAMSLTGLPPGLPISQTFSLNMAPGIPGPGVTGLSPLPGGMWAVDSFFDITYRLDLGTGIGNNACEGSQMQLHCAAPEEGCTQMGASNFNPCAAFDDGSCAGPPVEGCTYAGAANYNPMATIENGSCDFLGCMDPTANNYDEHANVDDGSCAFGLCPTDLNGDGVTSTPDLLLFLSAFGQPCE